MSRPRRKQRRIHLLESYRLSRGRNWSLKRDFLLTHLLSTVRYVRVLPEFSSVRPKNYLFKKDLIWIPYIQGCASFFIDEHRDIIESQVKTLVLEEDLGSTNPEVSWTRSVFTSWELESCSSHSHTECTWSSSLHSLNRHKQFLSFQDSFMGSLIQSLHCGGYDGLDLRPVFKTIKDMGFVEVDSRRDSFITCVVYHVYQKQPR